MAYKCTSGRPSGRKVGWYTDTHVAKWSVKINTLGSQTEHLLKDTKNTWKPYHPSIDHHNTTCHDISINSFSIVGREDHNLARSIKETILMRVNDPSLNRNIGKYQLSHIWDEVLMNSPELRLKWQASIIKAWGVITSVTYRMVLYNLNYNISLITSWLQWHNTYHLHIGSITSWT